MSHYLRKDNEATKSTLLNPEVMAINQDTLGFCAERCLLTGHYQVFVRPLSNSRYTVAILNSVNSPLIVKQCFATLGLTGIYSLRDVWQRRNIRKNARYWKGQVNSHETVLLVLQYYKYDNYHICQVVHIP